MIFDEAKLIEMMKKVAREVLAENRPASEYLSTAAAAKFASVAQGTIRRWIDEGHLAKHRAGSQIRVKRVELEAIMAAPRRKLTPEELAEQDD